MAARLVSVVVWALVIGVLVATPSAFGQGTESGEWRSYGGDIKNTRYSPLDQIDASNFDDLEIAWRIKMSNFGPNPEYNFQSTPLMVDGVIYSTAGSRRAVVAADAEAAAADNIDEWFKAERAELLAPGGVKGLWGGSGWLADEW